MYNVVNTLVSSFLIGSSSFLQIKRTTIKSGLSSKLSITVPYTYNGKNVVNTLQSSFLIGSSSFLQEIRTCI